MRLVVAAAYVGVVVVQQRPRVVECVPTTLALAALAHA